MNKFISAGLLLTRKLFMKHWFIDVCSHFKVVKNIAWQYCIWFRSTQHELNVNSYKPELSLTMTQSNWRSFAFCPTLLLYIIFNTTFIAVLQSYYCTRKSSNGNTKQCIALKALYLVFTTVPQYSSSYSKKTVIEKSKDIFWFKIA